MVGENGTPETPDWHIEARDDDTAHLMRSTSNAARLLNAIHRIEQRIPPTIELGENQTTGRRLRTAGSTNLYGEWLLLKIRAYAENSEN